MMYLHHSIHTVLNDHRSLLQTNILYVYIDLHQYFLDKIFHHQVYIDSNLYDNKPVSFAKLKLITILNRISFNKKNPL